MIIMPKELQEAVRASHGQPLRLAAPDTHEEYIVLPTAAYEQDRRLGHDPPTN